MGELKNLLSALGLASTCVAGLMKTQKFIGGSVLDKEIDRLSDEVTKDLPIRKALELVIEK
jgi:hypothetical protein